MRRNEAVCKPFAKLCLNARHTHKSGANSAVLYLWRIAQKCVKAQCYIYISICTPGAGTTTLIFGAFSPSCVSNQATACLLPWTRITTGGWTRRM